MIESWTIFNALKTVIKRVPRCFLKDPNFLWIIIRLWNNENQFVKFGEKKLSTHIVQEEDCFGSATIGLEVIWKWFGCQHQDTGEMEIQALDWQDQLSKHTRNKVRKIVACFPLSGVEDWTTQTARQDNNFSHLFFSDNIFTNSKNIVWKGNVQEMADTNIEIHFLSTTKLWTISHWKMNFFYLYCR